VTEILGIGLGIALLLAGATALIGGSSQIATRWGVSEIIVGLTIVAFGTSLPELVVNILSALRGETDLAFGNVVGSNIANFGLVLGAAAAIAPMHIHGQLIRRELPLLLLATLVITVMALDSVFDGTSPYIGRSESIVLLLLFFVFLYLIAGDMLRAQDDEPLLAEIGSATHAVATSADKYRWVLVIFGIALLYAGGDLTVRYATAMALRLEISATLVGLFVVAIGTSLPELVTSIIAAIRKSPDLALGNIVGSNIFNALFVLPCAGMWHGLVIPRGGVIDLLMSLLFVGAIIPVFYLGQARLGRPVALAFLGAYCVYAVWRVSSA